jgi:hypothetical protein
VPIQPVGLLSLDPFIPNARVLCLTKGDVMMRARHDLFPLALLPLVCAVLVTACAQPQNQQPAKSLVALHTSADLTKLQIESFDAGNPAPDMLYVLGQKTAQQVYKAALASPQPAQGRPCPAVAGPGYHLIFWAGSHIAEIVTADRGGCGDLFLRGGDVRQGTRDFWAFLDQAIRSAPHVKQPDHVEIVRYLGNLQMPLYARVTSTRQVQTLFTALSAFLSSSPPSAGRCANQAATYNDLFFYEGDVLFRAQVFRGDCSQVRIAGTTGVLPLQPTEQFLQQVDQELLSIPFVPVRPDRVEIQHAPARIQPGSGPEFRISTDQDVIQPLFHTVWGLPPWPSNQDSSCNRQGTAASYDVLTFSQGGTWLIAIAAFSGCAAISFHRAGITGGYANQATPEFWDQVRRAEL